MWDNKNMEKHGRTKNMFFDASWLQNRAKMLPNIYDKNIANNNANNNAQNNSQNDATSNTKGNEN